MVFGFVMIYILSLSIGALHIVAMLPSLLPWFLRVGIILLCFLAMAIVLESLR